MTKSVLGVLLDEQTLSPNDLDLSGLLAPLLPAKVSLNWQRYEQTASHEVLERVNHAQVIISNKVMISADVIASAPNLELVLIAATGLNNIDLQTAQARGIAVCHARNYGSASVAQHTFMLILSLAGNLPAYHKAVQTGQWSKSSQFCLLDYPVTDLKGKVLGLVGFGAIGQCVAQLAQAIGMQVMVAERLNEDAPTAAPQTIKRYPWIDVLQSADVLTLHCPLTPATHHLLDAHALAQMKPSALIVNTARGPLIEAQALVSALKAGRIAGAGLDVLDVEPPPPDDPLLACNLHNLIITPHMAWASVGARQTLIDQLADSLKAWFHGEPLPRRVV